MKAFLQGCGNSVPTCFFFVVILFYKILKSVASDSINKITMKNGQEVDDKLI